jgi:hypothetical protein
LARLGFSLELRVFQVGDVDVGSRNPHARIPRRPRWVELWIYHGFYSLDFGFWDASGLRVEPSTGFGSSQEYLLPRESFEEDFVETQVLSLPQKARGVLDISRISTHPSVLTLSHSLVGFHDP